MGTEAAKVSNLLLLLFIIVFISQILRIITLVPMVRVIRLKLSYKVSPIATICNILGKSLPSLFALSRYGGTYCGMQCPCMF